MDRQVVVLILVVALVFLAGVQAIQINDLKEEFGGGASLTGDLVKQATTDNSQQQSAPQMVGGC